MNSTYFALESHCSWLESIACSFKLVANRLSSHIWLWGFTLTFQILFLLLCCWQNIKIAIMEQLKLSTHQAHDIRFCLLLSSMPCEMKPRRVLLRFQLLYIWAVLPWSSVTSHWLHSHICCTVCFMLCPPVSQRHLWFVSRWVFGDVLTGFTREDQGRLWVTPWLCHLWACAAGVS